MATTAREMIGSHTDLDSDLLRDYRTRPDEITGRHVSLAAREGDPLAKLVVDDFGLWLGRGLAMVQDFFDPSLIVIGGGVSTDSDLLCPVLFGLMPIMWWGQGIGHSRRSKRQH